MTRPAWQGASRRGNAILASGMAANGWVSDISLSFAGRMRQSSRQGQEFPAEPVPVSGTETGQGKPGATANGTTVDPDAATSPRSRCR